MLEADDLGQEPKDDEGNLIEEFNPKSMSPLRCIAESDDKVPKKTIHTVIHAVCFSWLWVNTMLNAIRCNLWSQ